MFTKVDKIILGGLGVVIVTSAVLAIRSWGEIKYCQGRIDMGLEVNDILKDLKKDVVNKREA